MVSLDLIATSKRKAQVEKSEVPPAGAQGEGAGKQELSV